MKKPGARSKEGGRSFGLPEAWSKGERRKDVVLYLSVIVI
jgi:hypothetical protein